jgi:hypothetical protein
LPKELKPLGMVTLKKEEKSTRKILRLKEAEEARLRKEETPIIEGRENTRKLGKVISDEEEIQNIGETDKGRGFKKGNKSKVERRIYSRREGKEVMDKQELRSNAAAKFISHNVNQGKSWHGSQIRKKTGRYQEQDTFSATKKKQ